MEQLLMWFFNFHFIYHVISEIQGLLNIQRILWLEVVSKALISLPKQRMLFKKCYLLLNLSGRASLLCEGRECLSVTRAVIRSHCLSQRERFLSFFVLVPALFSMVVAGVIPCRS